MSLTNYTKPAEQVSLMINPDIILRDIDYCLFNPKTFKMYKFSKDVYKIISIISSENISLSHVLKIISDNKENESKLYSFFDFILSKNLIIPVSSKD